MFTGLLCLQQDRKLLSVSENEMCAAKQRLYKCCLYLIHCSSLWRRQVGILALPLFLRVVCGCWIMWLVMVLVKCWGYLLSLELHCGFMWLLTSKWLSRLAVQAGTGFAGTGESVFRQSSEGWCYMCSWAADFSSATAILRLCSNLPFTILKVLNPMEVCHSWDALSYYWNKLKIISFLRKKKRKRRRKRTQVKKGIPLLATKSFQSAFK